MSKAIVSYEQSWMDSLKFAVDETQLLCINTTCLRVTRQSTRNPVGHSIDALDSDAADSDTIEYHTVRLDMVKLQSVHPRHCPVDVFIIFR